MIHFTFMCLPSRQKYSPFQLHYSILFTLFFICLYAPFPIFTNIYAIFFVHAELEVYGLYPDAINADKDVNSSACMKRFQ